MNSCIVRVQALGKAGTLDPNEPEDEATEIWASRSVSGSLRGRHGSLPVQTGLGKWGPLKVA